MEKVFTELWEKGASVNQIAKVMQISEVRVWEYVFKSKSKTSKVNSVEKELIFTDKKVRSYVKKHVVSSAGSNRINTSKIDHSKFVKLWKQGISITEIADKLQISVSYVGRYAYEHIEECPRRQEKDEGSLIEVLWNNSVPISEIAQILGVSEEYVWNYAFCHESVM